MARHNQVGSLGEDIACAWLKSCGYTIADRNYRRKWGEIDIVTRGTEGTIRFVEVKTVSYETRESLSWAVSHETWRPEEMVHRHKQERLGMIIETWLRDHRHHGDWEFDIIAIWCVPPERYAHIRYLPNVILKS